ncbi:MAG: hypothetical protein A2X47_05610 [Lentisphaerae bacterium GWF2_38_69]|nr:MAG: hypothetical protein A2X47_05610 [Lentisphaerae bacterium GWF2_38_69]
MELKAKTVIARSPDQESAYLDGEIVMMNVENGNYYNFNEVGTRIWELIEKNPLTIEEIAEKIFEEFEVTREVSLEDTIKFSKKIYEWGLIKVQ